MSDGDLDHRPGGSALDRPALAPLVTALAERFGAGDTPVSLSLRDLPEGTRASVADLLGLDRVPAVGARIPVSRLVAALGLESTIELRTAVESVHGPLPDRRAARRADRAARDELWSWLAEQASLLALGGAASSSAAWLDRVRSQGVRGGVDVHRRRLSDALDVLRALPADGVPLASFSADLLDDPHALDRGRHLAAIVLDAVALAYDSPPATDAEAARRLWETVGVAPDPLSSSALAIGLPGRGPGPLGAWLGATTAASEPVVLTLAQLRRWPLDPLPPKATAFVVENPSLVAEAARRGWNGPPLICSSGRPTVAVVTLLRQLGAHGAGLRQHADFDVAGLGITTWLADRAGTTPWRFTADDYLAAVSRRRGRASPLGPVPETPWDPHLRDAMRTADTAVYEEELRGDLLASMTRSFRS